GHHPAVFFLLPDPRGQSASIDHSRRHFHVALASPCELDTLTVDSLATAIRNFAICRICRWIQTGHDAIRGKGGGTTHRENAALIGGPGRGSTGPALASCRWKLPPGTPAMPRTWFAPLRQIYPG